MLSSTNIGVELPRDIDSCVNWKTAPKGRRRAVRRSRNSGSGESNMQKAATTSSNGSDNASDEEFKDTNQVVDSESEKLGVTILRRRFSGPIQGVPIKKRMRLTGSSAPLPLDNVQVSILEAGSASFVEGPCHGNSVDFSGISMLADAACKGDLPDEGINNLAVSEVQSPRGENGVVMPQEASEVQPPKYEGTVVPLESSSTLIEKLLNDGPDEPSKPEKVSRVSRLHWDLNTVMDGWDSDQQDDDGANCGQNGAAGDCNTEVCIEQKEESEKKDENENPPITIKNNGDVLENAAPKENFESHATELRKENNIITDANPKDSILESILSLRNCSDTIPSFVPSSVKEEIKSENEIYSNQLSSCEHEQIFTCKPAEINPQSEPTTRPEQILEECTKEAVANAKSEPTSGPEHILEECTNEAVANAKSEPTTGPEQILEECIKESVANASGLEPKDIMMGNEQAGIDAMMGGNLVEHDSMAADDKLEHVAWQSDCDGHAEPNNCADLPHIETGQVPTSGNDNCHTTDNREEICKQVDSTIGAKVGVEVVEHTSSVEFHDNGGHSGFYPPKKDLEEDEYQYEDGELREPAMRYWGTDSFEEVVTVHASHEVEQGNYIMETLPDASVLGSFTLDAPQGEDKLLVADGGVHLDNCIDGNVILKLDVDSKAQSEQLENGQENNLTDNVSAEYMHSLKAKATGWDKQPESSRKNSESPLRQECRPDSSTLRRDLSLGIDTLRSTDDSLRNDKSFVRPRRSKEDDLDGRLDWNPRTSRMHERGEPSQHSDTNRRDEHWVETRINTNCTRHRTTEFGAPSYAPSNSGNATAASIAKVKSNGFMVAPDGTLVKAGGGSCSSRKCQNSSPLYHRSSTERDHRGFRSSRERVVSPDRFGGIQGGLTVRCAVEPAREQCHRSVISPGGNRQRSFSPHRGHIRHISPSHIGSRSRSRTRSPNPWVSPTARGRCLADHEPRYERGGSPPYRMGPVYNDRLGARNLVRNNHHHIPPHGLRCFNDRRCTSPVNLMRRSPPRNARFYQLDSPPPPLHRQRDEFYHQPMHSGRDNGFHHRRQFEEDRYDFVRPERHFERSVNGDGLRPRNSSHKPFDSYRSNPRGPNSGISGDMNHRSKEDRDSFKFVPGGRHNNAKYDKREMRDRSDGGDDAAARRRLS